MKLVVKYIFIPVCALLLDSELLYGQDKLIEEATMNLTGNSIWFQFGITPSIEQESISLRSNKENSNALKKIANDSRNFTFDFTLNTEVTCFEGSSEEFTFLLLPNYKIVGKSAFTFDGDFTSLKTKTNRVYSLGQLDTLFKQKKKIQWLDFLPSSGRELDFSEFKKLETIFTQEVDDGQLGYHPEGLYNAIPFKYPGDPLFWSDLREAKKLERIKFTTYVNHFDYEHFGNIYFLDGITSSLLELPELKSVHLEGISLFPVNYFDISRLEHLSLKNISSPELIMLATIFHLNKKDTTQGNWTKYLRPLDLNRVIDIRKTGNFKTYYKNGQVLCEGEFINGKPNGEWKFWYENGRLCQERSYNEGIKEGSWRVHSPSHEQGSISTMDTLLYMEYQNDHLIRRVDKTVMNIGYHENDCNSHENTREAICTSEYLLKWGENDQLEINKTITWVAISNPNDTLKGFKESWKYNSSDWHYQLSSFCKNEKSYFLKKMKGFLGSEAHYYYSKENINKPEIHAESESTIDLLNCYWERVESSDQNEFNIFGVVEKIRKEIKPEDWPCIKQ